MKSNDQRTKTIAASAGKAGFTLLEMIISLTVMSLVVLTLYMAFSLGVDVWKKMEEDQKSKTQRKAIALRLLQNDFRSLCLYTFNSEKGEFLFFAGGPQCVFYVTTNGLGAAHRLDKALFFACLYVHTAPNGQGNSLYVYKSGVPGPELLRALRDFQAGTEIERSSYVPPAFILQESVQVINNVHDAQFGYQRQAYPLFSGVKTEVQEVQSQQKDEGKVLAKTHWVDSELPAQISFRAGGELGDFLVCTPLSRKSPALDHGKR
ncbi:MAG: PulJ/GspJ family protein [Thermodesulfobacteriota bacterium]